MAARTACHTIYLHVTRPIRELVCTQIGFQVIDRLGEAASVAVDKKQHNALVGRGRLWGAPVLLAKPTTFMNSSGKAVRKLMDYYKVCAWARAQRLDIRANAKHCLEPAGLH